MAYEAIIGLFFVLIVVVLCFLLIRSLFRKQRRQTTEFSVYHENTAIMTTNQAVEDQQKEDVMYERDQTEGETEVETINIKAEYNKENVSLKRRLVFDGNKGVIYWGKPTFLTSDVPESSRESMDIENVKGIKLLDNGALLMRSYYIRIHDQDDNHFTFRTSESDGKEFVSAVSSYKEIRKNALLGRKSLINKYFKTALVVKLQDFVNKHSDDILRASADKRGPNPETTLETLYSILEEAIAEGNLRGILDRDNHEYRDRDFIVQQQKIIHLNVSMDFNSLIKQLGNKGIVLQSIQCPQCNGSCALPPSGAQFQCDYCGALITVTDIFEKFKALLG